MMSRTAHPQRLSSPVVFALLLSVFDERRVRKATGPPPEWGPINAVVKSVRYLSGKTVRGATDFHYE
jgi:hypothetical protein